MTFHRDVAFLTELLTLAIGSVLLNRFDPMDSIPPIITDPGRISSNFLRDYNPVFKLKTEIALKKLVHNVNFFIIFPVFLIDTIRH